MGRKVEINSTEKVDRMRQMDFKGKVCVVTGGALGIGRCITREFSKMQASIAFIDVDEQAGQQNLKWLTAHGCNALFFCGDIAEEAVLQDFTSAVVAKFGKVDYLINNACISRKGILSGCGYEDFNYVLRVGVTAPYLLAKLFLPYFNLQAAIVNISSTRATMSQADTESYTAAKGGISALTHALAVSLSHKVRVNAICPGWIDTGAYYDEEYQPCYTQSDTAQHPSGRVGNPYDIARVAMFLCHSDSGFINGESITVDGGMTHLMIYDNDAGWKYQQQEANDD